MILLLFYFSLAILVSFLCSILESVLLSMTPSFISAARSGGTRTGILLESLKRDVDRPLAAILSLNTIAHTVGAAGVGAQAQAVFGSMPVSVISGVLTFLILVFSEIIPKTLGAVYWRALAVPSAYSIRALIYLMWPLVKMSEGISWFLSRDKDAATISREEIHAMADLGHKEGVIDATDARVLRHAMAFPDVRLHQVMTPRPVVSVLREDSTVRDAMAEEGGLRFSRYPVMKDAETLSGYVMKTDVLEAAARDKWSLKIGELTNDIFILPEHATVKTALGGFLKRREHLAAVVDEFGSFSGVVTLEDAIETLIGEEIMDEGDEVEDMRAFARDAFNREKNPSRSEAEPPG